MTDPRFGGRKISDGFDEGCAGRKRDRSVLEPDLRPSAEATPSTERNGSCRDSDRRGLSRGATQEKLLQRNGTDLPTGIIDITLYRDDWTRLTQTPEVKKTEIHFSIEGKHVLLVDDVFFTGRTIRAALDALLDLGRPRCVELAVLIDRGHRELPICADYVGKVLETSRHDSINVELKELAGVDQVIIEHNKYPAR